jgi:hypothetical protein
MLVAVSKSFQGVKRGSDLETTDKYLWVEIPVTKNYNLLPGDHYFPPDCDVKIIKDCLNCRTKLKYTSLWRNCT